MNVKVLEQSATVMEVDHPNKLLRKGINSYLKTNAMFKKDLLPNIFLPILKKGKY